MLHEIHEKHELKDDLVLSKVVAVLHDNAVRLLHVSPTRRWLRLRRGFVTEGRVS